MPNLIDYQSFLQHILLKIQSARYEMLKTVSKQTVLLYREIGKSVSEKVQAEPRGQSIVEQLAKDLQAEFPWIRWFSARNIRRMKNFYEFYSENKKLTPLVAEIGRVQNRILLEKCKDPLQIEFYLRKTKEQGWSKLDLLDKIKNNSNELPAEYAKYLLNMRNICQVKVKLVRDWGNWKKSKEVSAFRKANQLQAFLKKWLEVWSKKTI